MARGTAGVVAELAQKKGVEGSSVELFELSTEGALLGVGLFVLTLAMMLGIWFLMKAITIEPFTFYTFPGRLYTFRIVTETSTRLVVSNTFSALLMWPLGDPACLPPTSHPINIL